MGKSSERKSPSCRPVRLLAACCGAWLAVAGASADGPASWTSSFSGVWNDEAPATTLLMGGDLAYLIDGMANYHPSGRRLEAFESWQTNGGRRYAGLFRYGSGDRFLFTGMTEAQFTLRHQQQFALGHRLIDVEVQLVSGARRFSGLWAPGSGAEQTYEADAAAFELHWQTLAATHHLVTFDTWWSEADGEVRAFGVFGSGAEPANAQLAMGLDWDDFEALAYLNAWNGQRLVDLETVAIDPFIRYFSGRWVPAAPARNWLGVFYTGNELSVSDQLFKAGHEFSGTSVEPGYVLPPPTASRMDMLDFDVTGYSLTTGTIIHGKPLHDAGTPGPPRPDGGG
jgi:hypothetical protein